ncbi:diguanylate cyclase, partial [Vibrio fortis]
ADILKAVVPEKNLTFRTAGNEFAFITYHSDPFSVCDAILRELKHSRIGSVGVDYSTEPSTFRLGDSRHRQF